MKILLIEDEEIIHNTILDNLEFEGYKVDSALDGETGLNLSLTGQYDLVLLDLMLPELGGITILKEIRKKHIDVPVIILTAKTEEHAKLEGFREGADDYICKPFSLPELLARIKAVAKRLIIKDDCLKIVKIGNGIFDFNSYKFKLNNKEYNCNKYEILILKLLSSMPGKIFSRSDIMHFVWGADVFPTDRTIDNYILKLRKKLEKCALHSSYEVLESIYGVGYKLNLEK
jgi:DNA-binding response OmpR family regulator